jgi:hypothetical protein
VYLKKITRYFDQQQYSDLRQADNGLQLKVARYEAAIPIFECSKEEFENQGAKVRGKAAFFTIEKYCRVLIKGRLYDVPKGSVFIKGVHQKERNDKNVIMGIGSYDIPLTPESWRELKFEIDDMFVKQGMWGDNDGTDNQADDSEIDK